MAPFLLLLLLLLLFLLPFLEEDFSSPESGGRNACNSIASLQIFELGLTEILDDGDVKIRFFGFSSQKSRGGGIEGIERGGEEKRRHSKGQIRFVERTEPSICLLIQLRDEVRCIMDRGGLSTVVDRG